MQHPEEGMIHAWLDGALPADQAAALESHVASCKDCASAVADARGIIAASSRIVSSLDAVPGKVIPAASPRPRSWRRPWLEGVLAAGLILGIWYYSGVPHYRGAREVSPVTQTPGVIPPRVTDSMPIAVPPRPAEPTHVAEQTAPKLPRRIVEPTLPPAGAAVQKSSIAAAQPTAAPRPGEPAGRAAGRLGAGLRLDEVVVTAADARVARTRAVAGVAAGSAAPPAAPAADRQLAASSLVSESAVFVGCYELVGASTKTPVTRAPQPAIIPRTGTEPPRVLSPRGYAAEERYDRFALVDEVAPTPGQLAVRILDPAGRPDQVIYGAGWTVNGDRALVRDSQGRIVVTLTKSDSGVHGPSFRVISCMK